MKNLEKFNSVTLDEKTVKAVDGGTGSTQFWNNLWYDNYVTWFYNPTQENKDNMDFAYGFYYNSIYCP